MFYFFVAFELDETYYIRMRLWRQKKNSKQHYLDEKIKLEEQIKKSESKREILVAKTKLLYIEKYLQEWC